MFINCPVYKDPDTFSWENYLAETGASAAPPRAFKTRPPHGFKPGMKLEVVDRRVPFLIRVASISAVKGHQVRVSFDGWPDDMSCWLDDDSPDIHPVGWCLKTGHPLEPPLTAEEAQVGGPCGVGGCRGLGSSLGGGAKQHAAASLCPYRAASPTPTPDRLAPPTPTHTPTSTHTHASTHTHVSNAADKRPMRGRPPKHKRVEEVAKNDPASDEESLSSGSGKRWRGSGSGVHSEGRPPRAYSRGSFAACAAPNANANALRNHLVDLALPTDPTLWSQNEVAALVARVAGAAAGEAAACGGLCGASLLMASREELVGVLRLRLGPAVKLYAAVAHLREALT